MQILSVNIGKPRPIKTKSGQTGIFKQPQADPVHINPLGLDGDTIIDTENHGGIDQAIYVYGQPDYDWWHNELGHALEPGFFGENLTITDLESASSLIGDQIYIGDVILEVTSPRIPCVTLGARMGDPKFVKRFLKAGRPGLYCRVLNTGQIMVGDRARLKRFPGTPIRTIEMLDYNKKLIQPQMRRYLETPVHYKMREACLAGLKKTRTTSV